MHRHRFAFSICASALLPLSWNTADAAIFDRDARQYVSTAPGSIYSPVGMVVSWGFFIQRRATGTLVDSCHVLTARHVLGTKQTVIGSHLTFIGAVGTEQRVSSGGTVVAAGRGFAKPRTVVEQLQHLGEDWLLLRLNACVGAKLGYADMYNEQVPLSLVSNLQDAGYPIGRNSTKGLTIDPHCRITGWDGMAAAMNDCAVEPGNSGGPVFRVVQIGGQQRLQIVGIETFGYAWRKPVNSNIGLYNAATPIPPIVPIIRPFLALDARN